MVVRIVFMGLHSSVFQNISWSTLSWRYSGWCVNRLVHWGNNVPNIYEVRNVYKMMLLPVFLGGGIGASLRYGISLFVVK